MVVKSPSQKQRVDARSKVQEAKTFEELYQVLDKYLTDYSNSNDVKQKIMDMRSNLLEDLSVGKFFDESFYQYLQLKGIPSAFGIRGKVEKLIEKEIEQESELSGISTEHGMFGIVRGSSLHKTDDSPGSSGLFRNADINGKFIDPPKVSQKYNTALSPRGPAKKKKEKEEEE